MLRKNGSTHASRASFLAGMKNCERRNFSFTPGPKRPLVQLDARERERFQSFWRKFSEGSDKDFSADYTEITDGKLGGFGGAVLIFADGPCRISVTERDCMEYFLEGIFSSLLIIETGQLSFLGASSEGMDSQI